MAIDPTVFEDAPKFRSFFDETNTWTESEAQSNKPSERMRIPDKPIRSVESSGTSNVVFCDFGQSRNRVKTVVPPSCSLDVDLRFSDYEPLCSFADVKDLFEPIEEEEIRTFLERKQDLLRLIKDAHGALRKIFESERFYLELIDDPADDHQNILLLIGVTGSPADELPRLDEFDRAWWSRNRHRTENHLTVDLKYE
jgi:hypothetical protein